MKGRVGFDAVNKAFRTKSGEKVHFTAEKPTKVPVRLSFGAKGSSSR